MEFQMCRLLIAAGKFDLSEIIDDFKTMAMDQNEKHENNAGKEFRHGDGWGIVFMQDGRMQVKTFLAACYEDDAIEAYRTLDTPLCVLHARKGSKGSVKLENVHPFQASGYAFCHNGTVDDELLYEDHLKPAGDTDSEKLFYYLISNLSEGLNERVIYDKYTGIKEFTGINSIVTDGETSFIVNWFSKKPEYYTLKVLETPDCAIISSEILPHFRGGDWRRSNNRDIYRMNTSKMEIVKNAHMK